ncbi:MAG: hypothetical protein AAB662_04150 [Patescibacteria group bacterium]
MLEVIPGILEKDWFEIERKIELVKSFAKTIHVDIIDGIFAPNTAFLDPIPFAKYTKDIFFEVHLMVENPIQYLKPFADAGFKRFLGQIEKMPDQAEFVAQAQILGEVGLALDGGTSIDAIKVPLDDLDCLQVMTIEKAGKSGLPFVPMFLDKVKQILAKTSISIGVDGGINDQTIIVGKDAGATRFVANSFLFDSEDPNRQYQILQEKLRMGVRKNG